MNDAHRVLLHRLRRALERIEEGDAGDLVLVAAWSEGTGAPPTILVNGSEEVRLLGVSRALTMRIEQRLLDDEQYG